MPTSARTSLILLPGTLNDADLWRDQIGALRDISEITVGDLTRDSTIVAMARRILRDAPPRFALAGFSLGGIVAQEVVRQAPDRVERLALLDTSIRPSSESSRKVRVERARMAARHPGFTGFGGALIRRFLGSDAQADKSIVERIRAMGRRLGGDVFVRQSGLCINDGEAVLRSFTGPLLILCGAEDKVTPPADHKEMEAIAPWARLVIVAASGHMTPMEKPEAVNAALSEWLKC